VGARFSRVPAHYPDPGNPSHYMNVFKTPTTLNDGQQQLVDNFAPRANLKRFLLHAHIWACNFHIALNFVSRCTGVVPAVVNHVTECKIRQIPSFSDEDFHVM
jgi:hypothetical protein